MPTAKLRFPHPMMHDLSRLPDGHRAIQSRRVYPTGTFVELPIEALEQSLVERFEERVRQHPKRVAVRSDAEDLTYDELLLLTRSRRAVSKS